MMTLTTPFNTTPPQHHPWLLSDPPAFLTNFQTPFSVRGSLSRWYLWAWVAWKAGSKRWVWGLFIAAHSLSWSPLDQRTSLGMEWISYLAAGIWAQNYVGECFDAQARKMIQHVLCQNKAGSDKGVLSVFLGVPTWFSHIMVYFSGSLGCP